MLLAFDKHNKLMAEAQEGNGQFTLLACNFLIFLHTTDTTYLSKHRKSSSSTVDMSVDAYQ